MNIYLVILLTLVAALFTSFSQMLFKRALTKKLKGIKDVIGTLRNRQILVGLCGYLIGFGIYILVLSRSQLSVVYPIFASSFIFITIISAYKFKERISMVRAIGITLIVFGIVIVALTA